VFPQSTPEYKFDIIIYAETVCIAYEIDNKRILSDRTRSISLPVYASKEVEQTFSLDFPKVYITNDQIVSLTGLTREKKFITTQMKQGKICGPK
jgi:hypothetical protein